MSLVAERWTVLSILRTTTDFLEQRAVSEPRLSAEQLLADVLDCGRLDLYLRFDRPLDSSEVEAYRECIRRRLEGEPVQYITGVAGFRGLDLAVDPRVLVPRPETEQLVEQVLQWVDTEIERGRAPSGGWRIIDVGTGSGAIACSLDLELDAVAWIVGVDHSPAAIDVARQNARSVGADRVHWVVGDLLNSFDATGQVDVIVANPPYLAEAERGSLPIEVAAWEPESALFAGSRGDEALGKIAAEAPRLLRPGGLLAMEVAVDQAMSIQSLIEDTVGLEYGGAYSDLAGMTRGVIAITRPPGS